MLGEREDALLAEFQRLDIHARTAYSATCAERLFPVGERYLQRDRGALASTRDALERVWSALSGGETDLSDVSATVESFIPAADDNAGNDGIYVENLLAAISFAARSWLGDSPEDAVYAARQVTDAADFAAQERTGLVTYDAASIAAARDDPAYRLAQEFVLEDLAKVKAGATIATLRSQAARGGARLAELCP